jgi:hypothetical protein
MITELLTLQNQLKVWHWQTESYAQHQALGKAYDELGESIDEFIEVFQGKYARIKAKDIFKIDLKNYDGNMVVFINKNIQYLVGMDKGLEEGYNDELLNIRDEMVATLQQLKYLLTLK